MEFNYYNYYFGVKEIYISQSEKSEKYTFTIILSNIEPNPNSIAFIV